MQDISDANNKANKLQEKVLKTIKQIYVKCMYKYRKEKFSYPNRNLMFKYFGFCTWIGKKLNSKIAKIIDPNEKIK